MRRKIAIIESSSKMGGVEFSTLNLASQLNPDLWDVTVICPEEGDLPTLCSKEGISVDIVPMQKLLSTSFRIGGSDTRAPKPIALFRNLLVILVVAKKIRRHVVENQYNIVLTKGLYAHIVGGLASKAAKVNCVWHVQDFISERYGGLYRFAFGILARGMADEIIADGTPIAKQLPEAIQDRVNVILNGVDLEIFNPNLDSHKVREELNISDETIVLGSAARLTPWKGQHYLIEAYARIVNKKTKTCLLLVGAPTFDDDRYQQKLHALVEDFGLEKKVIFTGFRPDLPDILAAMDIFAYTSVEKDTSPLSLISAMACGLPVVAFDIQGVREVLGEAGLLVPVLNVKKLTVDLEKLVENQGLRTVYAERSRSNAVKNFSLQRYVADIENVLSKFFHSI